MTAWAYRAPLSIRNHSVAMTAPHTIAKDTEELTACWAQSPFPSIKTTSYFPVYAQLFGHLRNTDSTFVETGILDGGSLFMWRNWLGPKARIIGVDLNPEAKKWESQGFEIHIGDQGDPAFWSEALPKMGQIDAFLDDGGHQSFQQIVTVSALVDYCQHDCVVAVEDTYTSFMKDFSSYGPHSFLEYAKDATDCIVGRSFDLYKDRFETPVNSKSIREFSKVFSIQFFNGIVAFQVSPSRCVPAQLVRNKQERRATDFRYAGRNSAVVPWPDIRAENLVVITGGAKEK